MAVAAAADRVKPADGSGGTGFGTRGAFTDRSTSPDPEMRESHHHEVVPAEGATGLTTGVFAMLRRHR